MRRPTILLVSLVCLAVVLIIFFGARRLILGPPAELVIGMTVRGVDGASLPETTLVVNAVSLARPSGNWVRLTRDPVEVRAGEVAENRFTPVAQVRRGAGSFDRIRLTLTAQATDASGGTRELALLTEEVALSAPIVLRRGETSAVTLALSLRDSLYPTTGETTALVPQIALESRVGVRLAHDSGTLDLSGGTLLEAATYGTTETGSTRKNFQLSRERELTISEGVLSVTPLPHERIQPSSLRTSPAAQAEPSSDRGAAGAAATTTAATSSYAATSARQSL